MPPFTPLPPIALTLEDLRRLEQLANAGMARHPQTADYLIREIERAHVLESGQDVRGFVSMGSRVEFRDEITKRVRTVTLVYPDEADVSAGKISVLTPIGAALIGLSKGQSIAWQSPAGDRRTLTVLSIDADERELLQPTVPEAGLECR